MLNDNAYIAIPGKQKGLFERNFTRHTYVQYTINHCVDQGAAASVEFRRIIYKLLHGHDN